MLQFMTKLDDSGTPHMKEAHYYTKTAKKIGDRKIRIKSIHGQWWILQGDKVKKNRTDGTDNGASVFAFIIVGHTR
jgi:hypothetical protein